MWKRVETVSPFHGGSQHRPGLPASGANLMEQSHNISFSLSRPTAAVSCTTCMFKDILCKHWSDGRCVSHLPWRMWTDVLARLRAPCMKSIISLWSKTTDVKTGYSVRSTPCKTHRNPRSDASAQASLSNLTIYKNAGRYCTPGRVQERGLGRS